MDLRSISPHSATVWAFPAGIPLAARYDTSPPWIMVAVGLLVIGILLAGLYLVGWAGRHRRSLGADDQLPGAPDRTHYQGPPPPPH